MGHAAQRKYFTGSVKRASSRLWALLTLWTVPVLHYADMRELERSIALAYSQASARLFELFFDRFRLLDHLRALKDYVMLGKGDFVEILMEQLG